MYTKFGLGRWDRNRWINVVRLRRNIRPHKADLQLSSFSTTAIIALTGYQVPRRLCKPFFVFMYYMQLVRSNDIDVHMLSESIIVTSSYLHDNHYEKERRMERLRSKRGNPRHQIVLHVFLRHIIHVAFHFRGRCWGRAAAGEGHSMSVPYTTHRLVPHRWVDILCKLFQLTVTRPNPPQGSTPGLALRPIALKVGESMLPPPQTVLLQLAPYKHLYNTFRKRRARKWQLLRDEEL